MSEYPDPDDLALLRLKAAAFDARREYHRKMNHATQQAMYEAEDAVKQLEAVLKPAI